MNSVRTTKKPHRFSIVAYFKLSIIIIPIIPIDNDIKNIAKIENRFKNRNFPIRIHFYTRKTFTPLFVVEWHKVGFIGWLSLMNSVEFSIILIDFNYALDSWRLDFSSICPSFLTFVPHRYIKWFKQMVSV